jgi:hypothetical protein
VTQPQAAAKPAGPNPEAEANARITELQAKVGLLQQQILTLEGKAINRDPNLIARLKKENDELSKRFTLLKKALFAIISESYQPRTAEEIKLQYEVLRKATVEYCQNAKVDPELWKSIAS